MRHAGSVRDDWIDGMPPDGAYGRVTDPERYALLHETATSVVDDLVASYEVDRSEPGHLGVDFPGPLPPGLDRIVHLSPAGGAAPVTVVFTSFPGLVVRYGRWHVEWYPTCGCDACDENPRDLAEVLTSRLTSVVTRGFHETMAISRRWLDIRYSFPGVGSGGGRTRLDSTGEADHLGAPGRLDWPPWRARQSA
jgi:hypothetical protein